MELNINLNEEMLITALQSHFGKKFKKGFNEKYEISFTTNNGNPVDLKGNFVSEQNTFLVIEKTKKKKRYVAKFTRWEFDLYNQHLSRALNELIAIKELDDRHGRDQDFVGLVEVYHELVIIGDDLPRLYLAVVFEYREGGDLAKSMKNEQRDENEWSEFYLRILKQLIWIHDRGFIHADIKPENIVLSARGPYIIDFGSAIKKGNWVPRILGTPGYEAPETGVDNNNTKITTAIDLWSLGMIICESVLGKEISTVGMYPNLRSVYRDGLKSEFFTGEKMRTADCKLLDLICRLLEFDPVMREEKFKFKDENKISDHPWFNRNSSGKTDFDNEIEMFQDPRTNQLRCDADSRPVYVIFKRLPDDKEGQMADPGHPFSDLPYSPKVVWCRTFNELKHWIEGKKVLKQNYAFLEYRIVKNPAKAPIAWDGIQAAQVEGDTPSSKLECVLVFYKLKK